MTALEFVRALRAYAPLCDARRIPEATALYRAYRLPLKQRTPRETPAPLLDLLTSYDTSDFELGRLRFWGPETYGNRVVCGAFDLDHLYIDRPSGEVRIGTRRELDLVRWRCAASQGGLLAALAHVASARVRAVIEGAEGWHPEVLGWSARVCAMLAGGSEYEAFYYALLTSLRR